MIQPRPQTIGTHSGCSSGRAMAGAAPIQCPLGHPMRYETTSNQWVCDLCGIDEELPTGTCMVGCRTCAYDMCAKHIPESYEFHKVEITIVQAVAGTEIAKVVVDVEMTVSALMNVLEEPLQTPSRYQRMMLEDEETAQSPVVSSGPARNPSGLMFALDFLYFWFHPRLKRCGTRRQDNCGHSLGA